MYVASQLNKLKYVIITTYGMTISSKKILLLHKFNRQAKNPKTVVQGSNSHLLDLLLATYFVNYMGQELAIVTTYKASQHFLKLYHNNLQEKFTHNYVVVNVCILWLAFECIYSGVMVSIQWLFNHMFDVKLVCT